MASFKRGIAAVEQAIAKSDARGGRTKYVNNLSWVAGEKKYVQFVTSAEELVTVDWHGFIIVGKRNNGKPHFEHFVSRQDAQIDGKDGYDPIKDRFGIMPARHTVAVAIEVVPEFKAQGDGKKKITSVTPVMRSWTDKDGVEHTEADFKTVNQSPSNFFGYLLTWVNETDRDITDTIWSCTRRGGGTDTSYDWMEVSSVSPLDLSEYADNMIDLEGYLEEMASVERIRKFIDPIDSDTSISNYAGKEKKSGEKPQPEVPASESSSPPWEEAEPKVPTKGGGFAALREKVKAAQAEDDE